MQKLKKTANNRPAMCGGNEVGRYLYIQALYCMCAYSTYNGKYIGRPSVVGFLLHRIGFNPRIVHVEFLVYTVAQEVIDFILPAVIHQYIIVVCHRG